MSMLREYLTRRLVFENHPALEQSRCLNRLQTRKSCTVCREVCPQGVFAGDAPDWTRCDGCGVCAARCPSRAIRPAALFSERVLALAARPGTGTVLRCARREDAADLSVPCLAALPWELLALLALDGSLYLLSGACADCPRLPLLVHWEETLAELWTALGEERFVQCVHLLPESGKAPPEGLSRREAFSRWFSRSRAAAAGLLPEDASLTPDGMLSRRLLAWRLKQRGAAAPALTLPLPQFTGACNGCGLCARLCPSQALHRLRGAPEDSDRQIGVWHLAVIPWRCTDCGLCETVCPRTGLRLEAQKVDLLTPRVHTVQGTACTRCGQPADGEADGLCPACRAETAVPAFFSGEKVLF